MTEKWAIMVAWASWGEDQCKVGLCCQVDRKKEGTIALV